LLKKLLKYTMYLYSGRTDMFAVIATGGKQYKVEPGTVLEVERFEGIVGSKSECGEVLLLSDAAGALSIGAPFVKGAVVVMEILEHFADDKVIVFKKKLRTNYRRKHGHKQCRTKIKILDIVCKAV